MAQFRIVSLCPSTTYTLFDLGLIDSIVGRTGFCIHPKEVKSIKKIGGTKNPNFDKIKALNPTHIMFNNEENDVCHIDELSKLATIIERTPVEISDAIESINYYGRLFSVETRANQLSEMLKKQIERIHTKPKNTFTYIYLIWREPIMAVGKNTFIESTLALFGGINSISATSEMRYPKLTKEMIRELGPDVLFLSSEPFPFTEKHKHEFNDVHHNIHLIDGEAASWHGSFMIQGLQKLDSFFTLSHM